MPHEIFNYLIGAGAIIGLGVYIFNVRGRQIAAVEERCRKIEQQLSEMQSDIRSLHEIAHYGRRVSDRSKK